MSQIISKHSRLPRKSANSEQEGELMKSAAKTAPVPAKEISAERRALILEQAKTLLIAGHNLKDISTMADVNERALRLWILGSEDEQLINAWVDSGLADCDQLLEDLDETDINAHIKLAKVRELIRSKQWYASKRSRERYGDDKFPAAGVAVPVLQILLSPDVVPPGEVIELRPAALPAPTNSEAGK